MQPGNFSNLGYSEHEVLMLVDAYNAIEEAGQWAYMRKESTPGNGGFMFCNDQELAQISQCMQYTGHSGGSFAWTMRVMELIAKEGWERFKKLRTQE